eukprot:8716450-Alexandrium_andersonii.AAC.1
MPPHARALLLLAQPARFQLLQRPSGEHAVPYGAVAFMSATEAARGRTLRRACVRACALWGLSLIHISEPTRLALI